MNLLINQSLKDLLDKYLKDKDYSMFYYVLGEKVRREENSSHMQDLSGSYEYKIGGDLIEIQSLRTVQKFPKQLSESSRSSELDELADGTSEDDIE